MSIRQEIKNLAAILTEEEDAAMDLWTCLPSHKEACERHGENALSYCPNPRAVMREAEETFRVLADHDSEDRTGLLSFFGCQCDTHTHTPTEETVEAVLGLYQPGFRWGRGLMDFDAEVDAGVLELITKQRDAALAEVKRIKEELGAAQKDASDQSVRAAILAEALRECERSARVAAELKIDKIDHQAALWFVTRLAHRALSTSDATDPKNVGPIETWKALEAGEALLDLQDELTRLMETPCSSMAFGFGPEETAKAVTSEVAEILAEPAGSEDAQRECAGLLAAAVRMAMVHGADPVEAMRSEALRIKTRLDTMDRLACSWATAKIVEKDPRLERLWVVVTMDAIQCEIAAWFVDGDDPHVAVVPREKITITNGILIGDCFPHDRDVRILPIEDARGWWEAIFSAEQAGYLVAIRDEQGARFEKAKP
jgi:hypothetical protein